MARNAFRAYAVYNSHYAAHRPILTRRKTKGRSFTAETVLTTVDDALKATLLRYSSLFPLTLTTIGKTAQTSAPGKVMYWRALTNQGLAAPHANWPMMVLRAFRAASAPGERRDWRRAIPAAVAVEIMVAAADLIDEWAGWRPSPRNLCIWARPGP